MWMRGELNPNNSAGTSNVEVAYYNSSNVEIGRDVVVSHDPGDLDQTWAEYHGIVTTPANTASLRVWVTNELNSGWVNYDDAYVIPQDGVKTTVHYQLAGQSVAVAVGADVSYVFSDHLGSTATSWNATSGASSQYYLPFGAVRHSDGLPSDVGYTGQKLDASTGLMFYNARYYDPLIGRFISADTIVPDPMNPQDYNRYTYVRNNPLNFTDPTGHCVAMGRTGLDNNSTEPCDSEAGDFQAGSDAEAIGFDPAGIQAQIDWAKTVDLADLISTWAGRIELLAASTLFACGAASLTVVLAPEGIVCATGAGATVLVAEVVGTTGDLVVTWDSCVKRPTEACQSDLLLTVIGVYGPVSRGSAKRWPDDTAFVLDWAKHGYERAVDAGKLMLDSIFQFIGENK